ncbi:MAG: gliding motility-associated C-terminal domain-containing protein [Bacteroidia bacterium]|nr:gliding motility-associated C-terminal domain-containing protein [Bacteroidia bacterium]
MRLYLKILIALFFYKTALVAQTPTCPSPLVYMDGPSYISFYDPSQPLSSTNPGTLNIPVATNGTVNGSGLALMPNVNGGTLSPTFYTTLAGNYWYWSGAAWVNTGHSTGNASAINIAGCGSTLYNLVGGTGQVYAYNGTGSGSLITTISGFNGGGPYDLVTDCNCNFYVLNTTVPNQALTLYSPAGNVICSYSLSGMPNTNAGGGFAIIGNSIYVRNNLTNGFFVGTMGASAVTFTQVSGFNLAPGDLASCPVCYSTSSLTGLSISPGGLLNCNTNSVGLSVTGTLTNLFYSWSGPGIIGATTGSVITVNTAGTYTCVVSNGACPPTQLTLTTMVINNATSVMAAISPSGNVCMSGNGPMQLVVNHNLASDAISWTGPGIVLGANTATISVNAPGIYSVVVTNVNNGCVNTDTVNVVQTPTINVSLSNSSLCAQPFNGSPNSIQMSPNGASNYTVLTSNNFSISTSGTLITCMPKPPFPSSNSMATATLIGNNGFCVDTVFSAFMIVPNPTVTVSPSSASICPYSAQQLTVSGASNFVWMGASGLNIYTGSQVIASPSATSVYSVFGGTQGCNSATKSNTVNVLPLPLVNISPPSATICLGSTVGLTAMGTATTFTWLPANAVSSGNSPSIVSSPNQPQQIYTLIGSLNTCTASTSATVTTVQPPVVNLTLSSYTVCANNFNNSPNSLIAYPSGALSYTLLSGNNFNVFSPNGASMSIVPTGTPSPGMALATATLLANSGVCNVSVTKTFSIIGNPVVLISPPAASICPSENKVFSLSGASVYTWIPSPNLNVVSPTSALVSPAFNSFYSVIGNSVGCYSDVRNAVVAVLPIPTVAIAPAVYTVCAGSTLALVAQGNGATYNWYPSNSIISANGAGIIANPQVNTIYTVVASINTCTSLAVATVSAIVVPTISIVANQPTVCNGNSTLLEANGALAYMWSPALYLNQTGGSAVIATPISNTTYTVQGFNGLCTGTGTFQVQIVKRPDLEISSETNQVCRGATLTLAAKGAEQYQWLPANGVQLSNTGSVVVGKPGITTNYTLIGVNSMGSVSCSQILCYSVMVVEPPVPHTSGSVALCMGQKTTLSASGGNNYVWGPSPGLNSTSGAAVVANPTVSTVYTVDVSYVTYCGATASLFVQVNPRPVVFAGYDTTYNVNEIILLNASGTGSLTWISGEAIACNECPQTRVFPSQNGCYVVEAQNEFGCKTSDRVCLTITREFSMFTPNSFTPNNDGLNDLFYVYGDNLNDLHLEIFNRWGQLVFESNEQANGWDGQLNGKDCAQDVYVYRLSYKGLNGKTYSKTGDVKLLR